MSETMTTIVAALIGAVLGSVGAVLIQYLLTSRSEKLHRREILIQRYLFQLQDALEMFWYRLDNLANQYDRFLLAESVIVHEGDVFRTSTYKEALEMEWLERAKLVIESFCDEQNNERVKILLDTLKAIAKSIENKTGIDSSLIKKPGSMLNRTL